MNMTNLPGVYELQVLAIGTGEDGANNFLKSSIGTAVVGLCGAFGIMVAVICIMRMVKHVSAGKPGEGFKVLIFGLLIAALLFNLNLTISGAKSMSTLVQKVFDSITTVTG